MTSAVDVGVEVDDVGVEVDDVGVEVDEAGVEVDAPELGVEVVGVGELGGMTSWRAGSQPG
jgi:hypothetical protein